MRKVPISTLATLGRGPFPVFVCAFPSPDADEHRLDNELEIIQEIAESENCGGFQVVFAFGLITNRMKDIVRSMDPIGPATDRSILLTCMHSSYAVLCYGREALYEDPRSSNRFGAESPHGPQEEDALPWPQSIRASSRVSMHCRICKWMRLDGARMQHVDSTPLQLHC